MSLDVQFAIARTNLLCQESPLCQLVIKNPGRDQVMLAPPVTNPDVPILRVTEVKTGTDTFQKGHPRNLGPAYAALPGEQKIEHEFPLTSIAEFHLPAEYDISALVPYDGGLKRAESKPVRVKIIPVTPRGLALAAVHDGWSGAIYGVTVNAASQPFQIVRHQFQIMAGGGVMDARPVANAPLRASPAISTTPNGKVSHAHWIAWTEDGVIACTNFDAQIGSLPVAKWRPVEAEFSLVHPLASEPFTNPAVRPPGAALLWVGDGDRNVSAFQVIEFASDGKIAPGSRCEAGGPRPVWMTNHFRSDGKRLVLFAQNASATSATLSARPWPRPGATGEAARLASWPGRCLGGGTLMMDDDSIHGATLVRSPDRYGAKLEVITWKLDAQNRFAECGRRLIPWGYNDPVGQTVVRVGPSGLVAVLVADKSGKWFYFNIDGELKNLPAGLQNTAFPLDMAFLGEADVVLIAGQLAHGFKVMKDDGGPLPHQEG